MKKSILLQDETSISRLIRLEVYAEETKREMNELKTSLHEKFSSLSSQIENQNKQFITRQEFLPVRMLVYGFVGLVMTSVIGAIIYLVIQKP